MSPILTLQSAGVTLRWTPTDLASQKLLEADLEEAIANEPELLCLADAGVIYNRLAVFRQVQIGATAGHTAIPDLLMLTDYGDVIVVEVKRGVNRELRGRQVIAQVVDYAASLSSLAELDLVAALTHGALKSMPDLVRQSFPDSKPKQLAARIMTRLSRGQITMIVAADMVPEATAEWVRTAGRQTATDFQLSVIEVRPYVCAERPTEVLWVPQPRVHTETVHRTTVVIDRNAAGEVAVRVSTDSAEVVEEAVTRSSSRRNRAAEAREMLRPVAAESDRTPEQFWAVLTQVHDAALQRKWPKVWDALSLDDKPHTELRGRRPRGFAEGRFGVSLLKSWTPSISIGLYAADYDHQVPVLAPDSGGDFDLVLDVLQGYESFDAESYLASPEFTQLRKRLAVDSGRWDFVDHLADSRCNRWHPLHLRRPLADILKGATTARQIQTQWMAAADEAIEVLLRGGELRRLRDTLRASKVPD